MSSLNSGRKGLLSKQFKILSYPIITIARYGYDQ